MKFGLVVVSLCCCLFANGQWLPSIFTMDTVRYSDRMGGKLDSVDMLMHRFSSTLPAGNIELPNVFATPSFFWNYTGGMRTSYIRNDKHYRFSAVPHVGFSYVFGAKGTQIAKMDYQQVFAKSILVNFSFLNDRSNGFLRNSEHKLNDLDLSVARKGKFYSFEIAATDRKFTSGLNGGIQSNQDPSAFPLVFMAVNKENAQSEIRHSNIALTNYFDFLKDSTKSAGFVSEHELSISQRHYTEIDTVFGLYNDVYIDSLSTNDKYQLSKTVHGAGFFYRANQFFFSAKLNAGYWKYYNMGNELDTLETGVATWLKYNGKKWQFDHRFTMNIIGAGNEWRTRLGVKGLIGSVYWKTTVNVEQIWPDVFQRSYYANNYQNTLAGYEKQFRANIENSASMKLANIDVKVWQQSVVLQNNYFWHTNSWTNDSITSLSFHQIGVRTGLNWGILSVQPEYDFMLSTGISSLVPNHVFRARLFVKGALFKTKKMIAYAGVDGSWVSGAKTLRFVPAMDVYDLSVPSNQVSAMFNLHAFGGFQIDEFRFFVRFENIGYSWNDRTEEQLENYPIPSGMLRVGITWDFFN